MSLHADTCVAGRDGKRLQRLARYLRAKGYSVRDDSDDQVLGISSDFTVSDARGFRCADEISDPKDVPVPEPPPPGTHAK